jgi:pyruvate dehydrogenase E2 component (dihydrolipoamide acetyltransferase)
MANVLLMPSLSPTMETGVISAWRKKAGDKVAAGDVLAEIETDKAAMEWELADGGYLRELLAPTGQELRVGTPIAVLTDTPNEDYAAALAEAKSAAASQPAAPKAAAAAPSAAPPQAARVIPISAAPAAAKPPGSSPGAGATPPSTRPADERVKISPYGKKLAEQNELKWQGLAGSGPGGRIVAQDVQAALAGGPSARAGQAAAALAAAPAAAFEDRPLSMMRKAIAKRLTESKQTVPHFQARRKVRMERMLDAREGLKRDFPDLKITVNDLLIKACAVALVQHPAVNSQFLGDRIRRFQSVDIAVAVGTEEGLITPVLRAAHAKGLREISAEMKALGERARAKKLQPEEYQGGTFTISNLGMFGVTEFNAIINTPQACILAVSATVKEPVVDGDRLTVGQTMNLTLSSDHRVVDGVTAAQFLATLAKLIENPVALLL